MTEPRAAVVGHPQTAMDRRAVIEQAKGIIMAGRRCTAEEASATLARVAEQSDRKPDELASALVASVVHLPKAMR